MTDTYAVFGNPIAHSKSPLIHAAFARQTGQDMRYIALLAPLEGFADAVSAFRVEGACGANVTVPFKEQAFALATQHTPRALAAGAVNTLAFKTDEVLGDNTDGAGLVRDIVSNLRVPLSGKRILLMGAGGAARGVILPLLAQQPRCVHIVNRTAAKAVALVQSFASQNSSPQNQLTACGYADLAGEYDVVINATAASLAGDLPPLPQSIFASDALAYDMMYGKDTPFLHFARSQGVRTADGLGMLVEQAAEAFELWRGVRPDTATVIQMLRAA
jgi:shikimate dehydrogenase